MGKTGWNNGGITDLILKKNSLYFIVLGFRFRSKHGTETFAREWYSPKNFFKIKVVYMAGKPERRSTRGNFPPCCIYDIMIRAGNRTKMP